MRIDRNKYDLACARACMRPGDLVAAGIPRGTLCGIFRKNIRPKTAGRIAAVLGVDVTELLAEGR